MGSYAWKRRKLATVLNFRGVDHVGRLVIVVVSSKYNTSQSMIFTWRWNFAFKAKYTFDSWLWIMHVKIRKKMAERIEITIAGKENLSNCGNFIRATKEPLIVNRHPGGISVIANRVLRVGGGGVMENWLSINCQWGRGVHKILQGPGGREQVNFIVTHLNPPKPTPSPLLRQWVRLVSKKQLG